MDNSIQPYDFPHSISTPDNISVPFDSTAILSGNEDIFVPFSTTEDFDIMVSDLRSTFVNWLKKTEISMKLERDRLNALKAALAKDKETFMSKLQAERNATMERLAEERKRQNSEIALQLKQVQVEREDARRRVSEERAKMEKECALHRKRMQMETEKLNQQVKQFEDEKKKIVDNAIASETMIDINVGGVIFETSRNTLTQQSNSLLEGVLSGRHKLGRDRQGRLFFDRDYELFRVILNFLRNPTCLPVPRDSTESELIINEASYYGIKFSPFPLVLTCGGHSGHGYLSSVEMLDVGQQCWRSCTSMQSERAYFGSAVINNFICVFGGQNIDYKALCETEMYDRLRDSWYTIASLHQPRRNNAGVFHQGRVYCVGGFDGANILKSVEAYDMRMKDWVKVASLNTPRSSAMVATQNDFLYAFGGTTGERLKSVEIYDPRMDVWQESPASLVEARSAGAACSYLNEMYIMGGIDNSQVIHSSVEHWDSAVQRPSFMHDMPNPCMDCSVVPVSDSIIVIGGQNEEILGSCYFYRPEHDEWQKAPSLITPRYAHCSVLLDI